MLSMLFLGVYFFAGMCLLVYVVIFLKGLFSDILDATVRASAIERARSTFAATKRMCRPQHILQPALSMCRLPPTDEEEREVFDLVGSKQLHRLQAFFKVAVHLHAAFIGGYLLMPRSIIFGIGRGSDWGAVTTNYVALALIPLFPVFLVFWSCPSTLSSSKMDAIYILFVARLCQCSVFMDSASSLMSLSHFSAVVRLAVGVLIGNPWLVGTVSFAYFFSVTWYFPWSADQCGEDITWNFFLQFFFREMFAFVAMLLLSVAFQGASYEQARATLKGKASVDMMNTVQSLLSVLSDAVLKLDSNWQLQEPSRQLSALLLKSEEMPQGASFADLLDAIDNRTFVQQMTCEPIATAESGARPRKPPSCMILRLQDSEETRVRIRLYHTTFSDPKGRLSYLVALREFQDFTEMNDSAVAAADRSDSGGSLEESEVSEEASVDEEEEARRAARRARFESRRQARREWVAQARQRRSEHHAAETQGGILAGGASASGGADASAEGRPEAQRDTLRIPERSKDGDGGGLPASSSLDQRLLPDRDDDRDSVASEPVDQNESYAASFNCQDAGFHIMRATPAFNTLMARYSSNKNLSAWVPHTSGFAEFVRAEVNQLPTQMNGPSDALEFGEIKFYPPGRRHEIEYKAQCTLRLHRPQGMGRVIGHIEMKNLRFKDKMRRRARERLLEPITLGRRSDDPEPQQSHRSELEKMSL